MEKELRCPHSNAAGSYYDPLPWSECHKDPPDYASKMSGTMPMCLYDAGRECEFYETWRKNEYNLPTL